LCGTIEVEDLRKKARRYLHNAEDDCIAMTRLRKPAPVLVGVDGEKWQSIALQVRDLVAQKIPIPLACHIPGCFNCLPIPQASA
jgi:hypothetical protein